MQGTVNYGLFYKKKKKANLIDFTDSDYVEFLSDSKSTSRNVFMVDLGAISWLSRKQPIVTLLTTKVEFVAATTCVNQVIGCARFLNKFIYSKRSTPIYYDSSSTVKLYKTPVIHGSNKHIDVKFRFRKDLIKDGVIVLI